MIIATPALTFIALFPVGDGVGVEEDDDGEPDTTVKAEEEEEPVLVAVDAAPVGEAAVPCVLTTPAVVGLSVTAAVSLESVLVRGGCWGKGFEVETSKGG